MNIFVKNTATKSVVSFVVGGKTISLKPGQEATIDGALHQQMTKILGRQAYLKKIDALSSPTPLAPTPLAPTPLAPTPLAKGAKATGTPAS